MKTLEEVRAQLPEWTHSGEEFQRQTGYKFTEQIKIEALKRFLPDELSKQVENENKWNDKTYDDCIRWLNKKVSEQCAYNMCSKVIQDTGAKGPVPMQIGNVEPTGTENLNAPEENTKKPHANRV